MSQFGDGRRFSTLMYEQDERHPRYEVGERLGAGGMAEVFRATAHGVEGFTRAVALKRVLPGYSTVPRFASLFIREAKLAARLSHANIVSVIDFDRDAEGRLFLVMEWVDGVDLARLARTGLLPLSSLIFVITEVLRGLGHAHDHPVGGSIRGVIHRDVSPHNILVSWDGGVKVSDFGLAKARDGGPASGTDVVTGKPAYMSPEQANAEPLDGRSDLFAVGVIAWELLTGRALFDAVTTKGVIAQVLFKSIERPSRVRRDVPADLEAIIMRLLERDLHKRYSSAEAAIEDLARCAAAPRNGRSELARVMAARFDRSMPSMPRPQISTPRRRRWPWLAAAIAVGASVGAALASLGPAAGRLGDLRSEQRPVDQMRDDSGGIICHDSRVPDSIRVDDRVGAVEAWTETTTRRHEHIGRAARHEERLHGRNHGVSSVRAASGPAAGTRVRTYEQVAPHAPTLIRSDRIVDGDCAFRRAGS